MLPGFIDSHVHLAWAGFKAAHARASPRARGSRTCSPSWTEAAVGPHRRGAWVDIAGYDQRALGRHLTAAELDRVSHGRKVFLMHDSGHACVVNTAVLELLPGRGRARGGLPRRERHDRRPTAAAAVLPGGARRRDRARRPRLPRRGGHRLRRGGHRRRAARPQPRRARRLPTRCATGADCRCASSSWCPPTPCVPVAAHADDGIHRGPRPRAAHRIRRRLALPGRAEDLHRRRHDGPYGRAHLPVRRDGRHRPAPGRPRAAHRPSSTATSPAGSSPSTPSGTAPPTSPWTPWNAPRSSGPGPTPATASNTPA